MSLMAGIDEVGLGAVCGPLVVAGVIIEAGVVSGVRDSKLVAEPERYRLAEEIKKHVLVMRTKRISVETINARGIKEAWVSAVQGCIECLRSQHPSIVIRVDGERKISVAKRFEPVEFMKNGDDHDYAIGAASLVAKATRDLEMVALAKEFPAYRWEKNKGYGTPEHTKALKEFGLTVHHRTSMVESLLKTDFVQELDLPNAEIDAAVAELVELSDKTDIGDWEKQFAQSIKDQWCDSGRLTSKQQFFLVKTLKKARVRLKIANEKPV